MIKLNDFYEYHSRKPTNPYAPTWHVEIGDFQLDDAFVDELESLLIGLAKVYGKSSEWKKINVFQIDSFLIDQLKVYIEQTLQCYREGPWNENLWIGGWFNYHGEGEWIKLHSHGCNPEIYLTGTLCFSNYEDVFTRLWIPYYSDFYGPIDFPSVRGRILTFPGCIPHEVTQIPEGERMSISWDLITDDDGRERSTLAQLSI